MALAAIAAIAKKVAKKAIKKRGRGSGGSERQKPKALSVEGIGMLTIAVLLESINVILGVLDFVVIGIFISPIINLVGTILIGGWLWMRFGKFPLKKATLPLIANSIPFMKFFPFWWVISVATSLDWKNTTPAPQEQQNPESAQ